MRLQQFRIALAAAQAEPVREFPLAGCCQDGDGDRSPCPPPHPIGGIRGPTPRLSGGQQRRAPPTERRSDSPSYKELNTGKQRARLRPYSASEDVGEVLVKRPHDPHPPAPKRGISLPPRLHCCSGPPHSAQRTVAESCASVEPIEIFGSQLIGLSLITRHRGQKQTPRLSREAGPLPQPPVVVGNASLRSDRLSRGENMRLYLYSGTIAALLATIVPGAAEDAIGNSTSTPTNQAEAAVDTGKVVVSNRPVEVLAAPSSSSSVLYGFPAGRPFRLIGREAGFAHIQDLKSSATGWIDGAAVAEAPAGGTSASFAPRQNSNGNSVSPARRCSTAAFQCPSRTSGRLPRRSIRQSLSPLVPKPHKKRASPEPGSGRLQRGTGARGTGVGGMGRAWGKGHVVSECLRGRDANAGLVMR